MDCFHALGVPEVGRFLLSLESVEFCLVLCLSSGNGRFLGCLLVCFLFGLCSFPGSIRFLLCLLDFCLVSSLYLFLSLLPCFPGCFDRRFCFRFCLLGSILSLLRLCISALFIRLSSSLISLSLEPCEVLVNESLGVSEFTITIAMLANSRIRIETEGLGAAVKWPTTGPLHIVWVLHHLSECSVCRGGRTCVSKEDITSAPTILVLFRAPFWLRWHLSLTEALHWLTRVWVTHDSGTTYEGWGGHREDLMLPGDGLSEAHWLRSSASRLGCF